MKRRGDNPGNETNKTKEDQRFSGSPVQSRFSLVPRLNIRPCACALWEANEAFTDRKESMDNKKERKKRSTCAVATNPIS